VDAGEDDEELEEDAASGEEEGEEAEEGSCMQLVCEAIYDHVVCR